MPERQHWSDPAYATVASAIEERYGLALCALETPRIENTITRAVKRLRARSLADLAARVVAGDAVALNGVVEETTVSETYFFRDRPQIDFLRQDIIPGLLREHPRGLKVWSAGCSSGEEAYTLAILLDEAGVLEGSRVIGTDISLEALDRAREALYRRWSLRGVEPHLVRAFFHQNDERFVVHERLRSAVHFLDLNLGADEYPSVANHIFDLHLIVCRNVFIYLNERAIRHAATRFMEALVDGGWLVLGPSDPILEDLDCERVATSAGTFYRRSLRSDDRSSLSFLAGDVAFNGFNSSAKRPARRADDQKGVGVPNQRAGEAARRADDQKGVGVPNQRAENSKKARTPGCRRAAKPTASETPCACDDHEAEAPARVDVEAETLLHLRSLCTTEPPHLVETAASRAVAAHPLSTELHFMRALVLLDCGRDQEAVDELNNVVYLDASLALPYFFLGSIHARLGNAVAARRAFRNARDSAAALPRDFVLPLSQGEPAGALHDAACARLRSMAGRRD